MKINIYYGGRGLLDDPTLYVMNKMQKVLEELNVTVEKFTLHELKNGITTLPQTLKEADGIILATTVEWYGIGGYLQQFLDACWLYGDKEAIGKLYMCPVVMSTTYGERESKLHLSVAWEMLGGLTCSGICGYIADTLILEMSKEYNSLIEKKAENLYRAISQKFPSLPSSNQAVKQKVSMTKNINLTPQETEQLSHYVSDDNYVQKQKEDIQELTSLFKDMLGNQEVDNNGVFIKDFLSNFKPQPGFRATYKLVIQKMKNPLILQVNHGEVECFYGSCDHPDVEMQITEEIMQDIVFGRMTFQRAFMGGSIKVKGDFKVLRTLDQVFQFM